MKCPHCGAWSEVSETRATADGMRRRRDCANGHRFTTFEVLPQVLKAAKASPLASTWATPGSARRWARNQAIVADTRPAAEVAREHGITDKRVRQIRAQAALQSVSASKKTKQNPRIDHF